MNYLKIDNCNMNNGDGLRCVVWLSGCDHKCPGCFNPETWDMNNGDPFTQEQIDYILSYVAQDWCSGLTLTGGDPLCQDPDGIVQLTKLCQEVHKLNKDVWLWTGYTWENIRFKFLQHPDSNFANLIYNIDILVDGPFIESMKDPNIHWRGSRNQRVIDVQASYPTGQIYLKET